MVRNHKWPLDHYKESEVLDIDMSAGPSNCDKCDHQADYGYCLDMHTFLEHEQDVDEYASK